MIAPRTVAAVATAGIGTLVAGTMTATAPETAYGDAPARERLFALAPGLGAPVTGVMIATTSPGQSMRPIVATLGAAIGGFLIGQHVLGRVVSGE